MRIAALLVVALGVGEVAAGEILRGRATAVDGEILAVAGREVRLAGIEAPPLGDKCPFRGRAIDCGLVARAQLADLTAGATVVCETLNREQAAIPFARCEAGGYDISEGMIHTGWARVGKRAPARYRDVEQAARLAGRGLWRGAFASDTTAPDPPPMD